MTVGPWVVFPSQASTLVGRLASAPFGSVHSMMFTLELGLKNVFDPTLTEILSPS
jgi:hypothetical protein